MQLDRARGKKREQRLSVLERTLLGAYRKSERARDLRNDEIRCMSDRSAHRDLVEQVGRFTLGRQATDDSRSIDDRLSECHGRAG